MKEQRIIGVIAIIALALVAVALWMVSEKTAGTYDEVIKDDKKYFVDFRGKENNIQKITLRSRGQVFNVEFLNGSWVLPDRHYYPVGQEKVYDIIANAKELLILESKTNKADELVQLGLQSSDEQGSEAVHITLYDDQGVVVADFIAGKRRLDGGRTFYARHADETQAYLVRGPGWLNLDLSPGHWLDTELYRIAKERIQSVTVAHHGKPAFTIIRNHANARKFRINEQGDRDITSDTDVANVAFSLSDLQPVGINPVDNFNITDKGELRFTTFDGLTVIVTTWLDADKDMWVTFDASVTNSASPEVHEEAETVRRTSARWAYIVSPASQALFETSLDSLTK